MEEYRMNNEDAINAFNSISITNFIDLFGEECGIGLIIEDGKIVGWVKTYGL